MATVPKEPRKLTFVEIVMNAEAEVIKAAYEARVEVDKLLALREEAYRRIAELEAGVEKIVGEPGLFVFPPPPLPVAGMETAALRPRRPGKPAGEATAPAPAKEAPAAPRAPSETTVSPDRPATPRAESPDKPAPRGSGSPNRPH